VNVALGRIAAPAGRDAALATVVLASALIFAAVSAGATRLDLGAVGLAIVAGAAVAFRRRFPVAALLAGDAATLAWSLAGLPGRVIAAAPLIACYTLAAGRGWRWGLGAVLANVVTIGFVIGLGSPGRSGLLDEPMINAVAVTVAAFALGTAVFYYRQNHQATLDRLAEQAQAQLEAQRHAAMQERLRIARDLHDLFGHAMAAISVQAGAALHVLHRQPEQAADALRVIKQLSDDGLAEARPLFAVLRGAETEQTRPDDADHGVGQIEQLLGIVRAAGVRADVTTLGTVRDLPVEIDVAVYRIAQEALTNVRRHANASHVRVVLDYQPDELRLSIVDDGPGEDQVRPGLGITGMRERVAGFGGRFHAGRMLGGGFEVVCAIPLPEAS
jgi:signal transduction histidine kinase